MTESMGPRPTDFDAQEPAEGAKRERSRSLTADAVYELVRNPVFWIAAAMVLVFLSMAVFPGLWSDGNPDARGACPLDRARQGPSGAHPFGFTVLGCDMWGSVVYGANNSIYVALVGTAVITVVGIILGVLAGFYGKWVDTIIARTADVFFGIPFIMGALLLLAMIPQRNVWSISLVISVFGWPQMTRIMRGSAIATKQRDFIDASRAVGASNFYIIRKHILPNSLAPVIVLATILTGQLIAVESTLTFLGVGFQRPTTSWGILVQEGAGLALGGYVHLLVVPAVVVALATLAFILLGDVLRDALDPRGR